MEQRKAQTPTDSMTSSMIEQYSRELMQVYGQRRQAAPAVLHQNPQAPVPEYPAPARPPQAEAAMPPIALPRAPRGFQIRTAPQQAQMPAAPQARPAAFTGMPRPVLPLRELTHSGEGSGTPLDSIGGDEDGYLRDSQSSLQDYISGSVPQPEPPRYEPRSDGLPQNTGTPIDSVGSSEPDYLSRSDRTYQDIAKAQAQPPQVPDGQSENSPQAQEQFEQFVQNYPARGVVKTQVFTARRALPVEGALVRLCKLFPDSIYTISAQYTDQSGKTEGVSVPAMDQSFSQSPGPVDPYLNYRIYVTHPDYVTTIIDNVPVFENVVSIQSVDMVPKAASTYPERRIDKSITYSLKECRFYKFSS